MSGGEGAVRASNREDGPLYGHRQRFSQTREFRRISGAMNAATRALTPHRGQVDSYIRLDVNDYAALFREVTGFTPLSRDPTAHAFADALFGWASNRPGIRGSTLAVRSGDALNNFKYYLRTHIPPRLAGILKTRLEERFNRFADIFFHAAEGLKGSEDPADQKEEIRLLMLSAQCRVIVESLFNNGVDFRNLQLLDQVMGMMLNARTVKMGDGIISFITRDNKGRLHFPARFEALVRMASSQREMIPQWRSALIRHFGDNRVQNYMSAWAGENGISAGVTNWFFVQDEEAASIFSRLMRQAPREIRRSAEAQADFSILALLETGETGLAQKFLVTTDAYNKILRSANYTATELNRALYLRDIVYGLMNIAVSQGEMTDERRNLFERSLELMRNTDSLVSGYIGEKIPQMMIALLGYRQLDPFVERQLVGLFDDFLNPFSAVVVEMWQTEIETGRSTMRSLVIGVLKDLLYVQREIGKAALSEDQQRYLFSNSVAAKVLNITQTRKLNGARIIMMLNALDAHEKGNKSETEYYMRPLQDPSADIQAWIDNLSGLTFETIDVALEERYYSLTETTFGGAPSSVSGLTETGEVSGGSASVEEVAAGTAPRARRSGGRRVQQAGTRQSIRPRREVQTFRPMTVTRPVSPVRVR